MSVRQRVILIVLGSLIVICNLTNFYIGRVQSVNYIAAAAAVGTLESELDDQVSEQLNSTRTIKTDEKDHSFADCDLVHVNLASATELEKLPGIGPVLALRIVETREQGLFETIEDLNRVSGIGAKKFQQIAPLACLAANNEQ